MNVGARGSTIEPGVTDCMHFSITSPKSFFVNISIVPLNTGKRRKNLNTCFELVS